MTEERDSMVDHPNSFKTLGLQEFSEEVEEYLYDGIDRDASEVEVLKTIVKACEGQEVGIATTTLSSGACNKAIALIIDWEKEKESGTREIYRRFLDSGFQNDYTPFACAEREGIEILYLAEKTGTPSPWVRVFNDESTATWVGHYFANSLRNCGIIMPDQLSEWMNGLTMQQTEALYREQMQALKDDMANNISEVSSQGLLDPVDGISMEDWAAANAKIASGENLDTVLGILGIGKAEWDAVSAEWNSRMAGDTTHAIATVYGEAFSNSNIGRFAGIGTSAGEQSSGTPAADDGTAAVLEDFELYVKIMAHQNAGAMKGEDASTILSQYGLTPGDWGSVSARWSEKMAADMQLAMKMGELLDKYTVEFS